MEREDQPVKLPPAYFRAMLARAGRGQLNLQAAVFAQLKRVENYEAS